MPYFQESFTPTTGSTIMIKTTSSSFFNNEVTLTDGTTTLTSAFDADGVCIFSNVFLTGELTASSVNGSNVIKEKINIPHVGATIMRNAIVASSTLNDNDWSTIQAIAKKGSGAAYWNVGDRKAVTFNGTIGYLTLSNYTCYAYILGFDHNKEIEGTAIHFQIGFDALTGGRYISLVDQYYDTTQRTYRNFQCFNMNPGESASDSSNAGGWASCGMRTVIIPALKAAMPSVLQSVLKAVTKYTDNVGNNTGHTESNITATQDEIFFLADCEIWPKNVLVYSNKYEQDKSQQYDYYKLGNEKFSYRHNTSGTGSSNKCRWWERSPLYYSAQSFLIVGGLTNKSNYDAAAVSFGISPAFTVG